MSKKAYNPWVNRWKNNFKGKKKHSDPGVVNTGNDKGNISEPTIFCNHTGEYCLDSRLFYPNLPQFIQAAFIDPGKVSCAIRIVRYFIHNSSIEVLWFGIHNFGVGMEQIIMGVETELLPIKEKLQMCHHIIIESQFMKSEVNFRTFQHMISHIESFTRNTGIRAIILEVDIALKTVFIGGPRNKNQYGGVEIKEWSKQKAKYELLNREDYVSYCILKSSLDKQYEDLSDTVCYEFAWWYYIRTIKHLFINVRWLYILL